MLFSSRGIPSKKFAVH
jgi:hypothetical protein